MSFLDALRRPAVRMPLVLLAMIALGAWLSVQYKRAAVERALATARHLRCVEMVARSALERAAAGHRPKSLAELVGTPESPGELESLFLREYAKLPEFAAQPRAARPPSPAARPPLPSLEVRGAELLWEGYCYRLWPGPANDRDFVVFAWPEAAAKGKLTSAFLSTDPERLYFTISARYAGTNNGPEPADLGEPFAGKVTILEERKPAKSPEELLERLAGQDGRVWARMDVREQPVVRASSEASP